VRDRLSERKKRMRSGPQGLATFRVRTRVAKTKKEQKIWPTRAQTKDLHHHRLESYHCAKLS
jgi:hypothetical protein